MSSAFAVEGPKKHTKLEVHERAIKSRNLSLTHTLQSQPEKAKKQSDTEHALPFFRENELVLKQTSPHSWNLRTLTAQAGHMSNSTARPELWVMDFGLMDISSFPK